MPTTIALQFPAGRFHATLWGRHVNDERPEWPPSPWRLLRALAAAWKQKCSDDPHVNEHAAAVFSQLASGRPVFQLPRTTVGHTRHYMPERNKPTLVLDRFVAISRRRVNGLSRSDTVYVQWPAAGLTFELREVLSRMLRGLTYLGRAESWCDAKLMPEDWPLEPNCAPATEGATVPVLIPDQMCWDDWSYNPRVRRPDPAWNLLADSPDVREAGYAVPPGAKWENYALPTFDSASQPKRCVNAEPLTLRTVPTVARFLLDGPVLPLVTDTVRVAEAVRHAVLVRFQRHQHGQKHGTMKKPYKEQFRSEVLSGKDAAGKFLRSDGQHRHAYYLPTADGPDGRRITHVTVFARDGFGPGEVAALTGLRSVKVGDGDALRVQLVGLGREGDFTHWLFEKSRVWESVTPFVAHRHLKRRGQKKDTPHLDGPNPRAAFVLRAAVEAAGPGARALPVPAGKLVATDFRRERSRPGDDGRRRACGLVRIVFPEPVSGPLSLGYACHYGLGSFRPEAGDGT